MWNNHRAGLLALALAVTATLLPASAARGQTGQYREAQARGLRMQRRLLLAMADSMPERLYRDKATPIQRDFAQQIRHAAGEAYRVGQIAGGVAQAGPLPDTTIALSGRAGLRSYITAAYDQLDQWLSSQTEPTRSESIDFFGARVARWEVWDEILAYTVWTAGQVVANFRKNGMAPPGFRYFPETE